MNKYIIGAYPCAPSFHYKDEEAETKFFNILKESEHILGLEQPYLESFHPLGNDYFFKTIDPNWKIVITAIMYTMSKRGQGLDYGLASTDKELRTQSVNHILSIIKDIEKYGQDRFLALQIQSAPNKNNFNYKASVDAFYESIQTITKVGTPCKIVIEHCDSINGKNIRKGFLDLQTEIEIAKEFNLGICINWARSVLEGNSAETPVQHINLVKNNNIDLALLFSGTATGGSYGNLGDNHAPFKTFNGSRIKCDESLLTIEKAKASFDALKGGNILYEGAKLLEIDDKATVEHRADILLDAIDALNLAKK